VVGMCVENGTRPPLRVEVEPPARYHSIIPAVREPPSPTLYSSPTIDGRHHKLNVAIVAEDGKTFHLPKYRAHF